MTTKRLPGVFGTNIILEVRCDIRGCGKLATAQVTDWGPEGWAGIRFDGQQRVGASRALTPKEVKTMREDVVGNSRLPRRVHLGGEGRRYGDRLITFGPIDTSYRWLISCPEHGEGVIYEHAVIDAIRAGRTVITFTPALR